MGQKTVSSKNIAIFPLEKGFNLVLLMRNPQGLNISQLAPDDRRVLRFDYGVGRTHEKGGFGDSIGRRSRSRRNFNINPKNANENPAVKLTTVPSCSAKV